MHLALTRENDTLRLFKNGVQTKAEAWSDPFLYSGVRSDPVLLGTTKQGGSSQLSEMNGTLDDIRVTKGVARYTEEFTKPTEPHEQGAATVNTTYCLLYTSPSPRDGLLSRMPSSA